MEVLQRWRHQDMKNKPQKAFRVHRIVKNGRCLQEILHREHLEELDKVVSILKGKEDADDHQKVHCNKTEGKIVAEPSLTPDKVSRQWTMLVAWQDKVKLVVQAAKVENKRKKSMEMNTMEKKEKRNKMTKLTVQ